MREVARVTHQVAPSQACVLIVGETGTGKELIARAVHDLSPRFSGPYIRVNCGALTESLLESELFGHVKGSFTGAVDNRTGRFEAAHTGSIFLDEINSTTPKLQVKLLRVLQEGEFERVGDIRTVKVDTRIIAATNRDLLDEIDAGRFREDLYYRLNVVPIYLPPLRERREDIGPLVEFFLKRYADQNRKEVRRVHPEAMRLLRDHDWPGNVRELQNYVERAVILGDGPELTVEHLPPQLRGESPPARSAPAAATSTRLTSELVRQGIRAAGPAANDLHNRIVGQVERELIQQVLASCERVQIKAAARLGINRNTLHKKLAEFRIDDNDADDPDRPAPKGHANGDSAPADDDEWGILGGTSRSGGPSSRSVPLRGPAHDPRLRPAARPPLSGRLPRMARRGQDRLGRPGLRRPAVQHRLRLRRLRRPPRRRRSTSTGRGAGSREVARVLKPDGTFWLAIGDEFAAELKVIVHRELGLSLRNWVIWYYTFGVHCTKKFSAEPRPPVLLREGPEVVHLQRRRVRVPSARQLVYADSRANPRAGSPTTPGSCAPRTSPTASPPTATPGTSPASAARSRSAPAGTAARCPSSSSAGSSAPARTPATSSSTPSAAAARRWSSPRSSTAATSASSSPPDYAAQIQARLDAVAGRPAPRRRRRARWRAGRAGVEGAGRVSRAGIG